MHPPVAVEKRGGEKGGGGAEIIRCAAGEEAGAEVGLPKFRGVFHGGVRSQRHVHPVCFGQKSSESVVIAFVLLDGKTEERRFRPCGRGWFSRRVLSCAVEAGLSSLRPLSGGLVAGVFFLYLAYEVVMVTSVPTLTHANRQDSTKRYLMVRDEAAWETQRRVGDT